MASEKMAEPAVWNGGTTPVASVAVPVAGGGAPPTYSPQEGGAFFRPDSPYSEAILLIFRLSVVMATVFSIGQIMSMATYDAEAQIAAMDRTGQIEPAMLTAVTFTLNILCMLCAWLVPWWAHDAGMRGDPAKLRNVANMAGCCAGIAIFGVMSVVLLLAGVFGAVSPTADLTLVYVGLAISCIIVGGWCAVGIKTNVLYRDVQRAALIEAGVQISAFHH